MKLKDTQSLFHFLCLFCVFIFSFLPVITSFMVIKISQLTWAGEKASGFLTPQILFVLFGTMKQCQIAPGKWGYFDQIIFNANKAAFGGLFCFSQAPTILSHIIPRPPTLLEARTLKEHWKQKVQEGSCFFGSYLGLHLRP